MLVDERTPALARARTTSNDTSLPLRLGIDIRGGTQHKILVQSLTECIPAAWQQSSKAVFTLQRSAPSPVEDQ